MAKYFDKLSSAHDWNPSNRQEIEDITWVVILPGGRMFIVTYEDIKEGTVTNIRESWEYGAICVTSPRVRVA